MKTVTDAHVYRDSPVGPLMLAADDPGRLSRVEFAETVSASERANAHAPDAGTPAADAIAEASRQLDEYFAGSRHEFDLELAPHGTTFQLAVWEALLAIPYGATASYGDIARVVGRPSAVRAVGQANGRNPLAIVVPCHRVIGSNHSLTGYGGGLDRKRFLLSLEGSALTPALDL